MIAGRLGVIVMSVLLGIYIAFTINYAITCIMAPQPLAQIIGWALLFLPLLAIWWLIYEFTFIARGQRLLRRLREEGGLPVDDLPRLPSGRVDRSAAQADFDRYRAEVEADDASWRAWVRLALAYDVAGDKPRARWAMRSAIRRASPRA